MKLIEINIRDIGPGDIYWHHPTNEVFIFENDDELAWKVLNPDNYTAFRKAPTGASPATDVRTEAENRYPYAEKNITLSTATYNSIMDCQREAWVSASSRYRPEVEALRARIKELEDWMKYIPALSNVPDKTGLSREWQLLWEEIEKWYGDVKKNETGQQFLLRMQSTFDLVKCGQHDKVRRALEYLIRDVKSKPNDTRYATAIAKAVEALK